MAIVYSCICENGSAGAYWAGLSAAQRLRYGESGSERVFGGLRAWQTARGADCQILDTEVVEICDAFVDSWNSNLPITYDNFDCFSIVITSMVDGVRSPAFHGGSVTGGYVFQNLTTTWVTALDIQRSRVVVDGIRLRSTMYNSHGIRLADAQGFFAVANNIAEFTQGTGFSIKSDASNIYNNIAYNCTSYHGFDIVNYGGIYNRVYNNLAAKCGTGFRSVGTPTNGAYLNNVAVGCTTNWTSPPNMPDHEGMKNNAGEAGDLPWDTNGSAITTVSPACFVDYDNNDFRLARNPTNDPQLPIDNPLINAGVDMFAVDSELDILGHQRPDYQLTGEAHWDIGPFEYNRGNTPAVTYDFTLTGIPATAEIRIYEKDPTPGVIGTELSGVESHTGGDYTYTYEYSGNKDVAVQVMHADYEEYLTYYTLRDTDQIIPINLTAEENV